MICTGVILQSALNEVMAVDGGPGYYDVEDNGKYVFVSMLCHYIHIENTLLATLV